MKRTLWHNPWFLIPSLLFLNTAMALLLFVPHGDEILFFNSWRTEPLNSFFRFCTELGEPLAFVFAGLTALLWRFRYAVILALGGLILPPVSYLIKDKIGKDRPITYFEKRGLRDTVTTVPGVTLNGGQTSFPSGHTTAAFAQYGAIALLAGSRRAQLSLLCAITAILVGISRIFLVQHFLADIMAGAILGMLIAGLLGYIDHRLFRKWPVLDQGLLSVFKKQKKQDA